MTREPLDTLNKVEYLILYLTFVSVVTWILVQVFHI